MHHSIPFICTSILIELSVAQLVKNLPAMQET